MGSVRDYGSGDHESSPIPAAVVAAADDAQLLLGVSLKTVETEIATLSAMLDGDIDSSLPPQALYCSLYTIVWLLGDSMAPRPPSTLSVGTRMRA